MRQIKLSICIPTFNRSTYLDKLLYSISQINQKHLEEIEICISDNKSTDSTAEVIKKWEKTLYLNHSVNKLNYGAIKNVVIVVNKAKGKFIWIIGDDDFVIPEAVADFCERLNLYKDNYDWFLFGTRNLRNQPLFNFEKVIEYSESKTIFKSLLKYDNSYMGFLGHHIFSKEKISQNLTKINFSNHCYPHLTLLLSQPLKVKWISKYTSIKSGDLEWDALSTYFVLLSYLLTLERSYFGNFEKSILMFKYAFGFKLLKYNILASMSHNYSYSRIKNDFQQIALNGNSKKLSFILSFHKLLLIILNTIPFRLKNRLINYDLYQVKNIENEGHNRKL
ncbi:MAG: glycosyltransferase family 2 protein [Flavobacteriaceae bacterium]